jgi:hypothetical protein
MTGRNGESEAGRNSASLGNRSSRFSSAINDGQWHSFGNSGSSARSSEGRNSGGSAHSTLLARNAGIADGGWHSFGPSRGAFGSIGAASRVEPGFGWRGGGWRGGGWGGGWGWGRGWGWGWGFGVGWPYWGWGFAWDPWWYNPYWYSPWPAYTYDPGYNYDYDSVNGDWSDGPPYRLNSNSSNNDDSPGADVRKPSLNYSVNSNDDHVALNSGASTSDNGNAVQNGPAQP